MAEGIATEIDTITKSGFPQGRLAEVRKQYEPIRPHVNATIDNALNKGLKPKTIPIVRHIAAEAAHLTHQEATAQHAELKKLAVIDGLTGLLTRGALDDAIQQRINTNRIKGTGELTLERRRPGATSDFVVLIDTDKFKEVNDSRGHGTGDKILKALSDELRGNLRNDTDIIGRYGGDEFVAYLQGVHSEAEVTAKMNTIRQKFQDSNIANAGATITVGLAPVEPWHRTVQEAYEAADANLYMAKEAGKNIVFGPEEVKAWRRRKMELQPTQTNA